MLFTRSAELYSGERIGHLLPLKPKNSSGIVSDFNWFKQCTNRNSATNSPFLPNAWESYGEQLDNLQKKGQWMHHKNTLWENSEDECCSNTIYVILNKEFHLNKFYFILQLLFSLYNAGHKWCTTTWGFPLSPVELPKSADTLLNAMTEKWNFL